MRRYLLVAVVVAVSVFSGCATRQADLTLISTRNVRYENILPARRAQNPVPVEGYDFQHWLLFFPITGGPNLEEAVDDAMDSANGDCMVDAVIYRYGWYIPLIYGRSGWKVRGKVLNTYRPAPQEE